MCGGVRCTSHTVRWNCCKRSQNDSPADSANANQKWIEKFMKNTIEKDNTVCVLGLGYVGLTLATVLSDVGFVIFGVDKNKQV